MIKKDFILIAFTSLLLIFNGCNLNTQETLEDNTKISFMTWNTQTFFDGITEGSEYSDFKNSKSWNNDKYKIRLQRLRDLIFAINADIIVLQELENEGVMQDISNMLAGNSWDRQGTWPYGCFSKEKNHALGCGFFSKYPILNIKTHTLSIETENDKQPSMRPLIEVTVNINEKPLTIFINHWKSKYGGAEVSDKWRTWQENILCKRINTLAESGIKYCIAAGDFNKDINEFKILNNKQNNVTLDGTLLHTKEVEVYSPWLKENGEYSTETGSYYFNGKWERIDNIFSWGKIRISDFTPVAEGPWVDEYKRPIRYFASTGNGYSDHLPLFCTLTF